MHDFPVHFEHRFYLQGWHGFVPRGVALGSAYLITCSNPLETNWELLQVIGLVVRKLGSPYIIGRGFSMASKTLAESGWLEYVGGK